MANQADGPSSNVSIAQQIDELRTTIGERMDEARKKGATNPRGNSQRQYRLTRLTAALDTLIGVKQLMDKEAAEKAGDHH